MTLRGFKLQIGEPLIPQIGALRNEPPGLLIGELPRHRIAEIGGHLQESTS